MMINEQIIHGKRCTFCMNHSAQQVLLWGMYPFADDTVRHVYECLMELADTQHFLLAAYQAEDWNKEFSPWEADAVVGEQTFAGGGKDTLNWIEQHLIPFLKENYECRKIYTAGYSLAGLFSLWALYESAHFDGAVCCSGSLWFPGWKEYLAEHDITQDSIVYLSLGGKEEKTKHPVMSTIGTCTRAQDVKLKKDSHVTECILEWNSGGHFADSGKRLAKGMAWILEHGNH